MRVEQLMTRNVQTCTAEDPLNAVARVMWERDCGCVPVVAAGDGGMRVVGMITDRDVCMAAYTQGRPLAEIPVGSVMSREVRTCHATDSIGSALKILGTNQLHRLPVLDDGECLVGLLSVADVAREATCEHRRGKKKEVTDLDVADVVEAISAPRSCREVATAA
jgi:CBS-domain-containing membrane protein